VIVPTLHRLLWGPSREPYLRDWCVRPWEVPAVGLPVRVAVFLYLASQASDPPDDWTPAKGPLTWQIGGDNQLLPAGRWYQFSSNGMPAITLEPVSMACLALGRTCEWEVPPHSAYFLPFVATTHQEEVDPDAYTWYCDVLALLTALDGGETILDGLVERGLGVVPLEDRWAWRSRIHLPTEAWQEIELALRWPEAPLEGTESPKEKLGETLKALRPTALTLDDFARERVDISLDGGAGAEVVRTVRLPDSTDDELPPEWLLNEAHLKAADLLVRIGQIPKWPSIDAVVGDFPAVGASTANHVLEQIASAFHSPNFASSESAPDLVLLPEVSIPQPEVRTVRDLVKQTRVAALGGLYWRVLPPVAGSSGTSTATTWFVNEAELVVPVPHNDRGPTDVRWYRVRKPVPAHIEAGLAKRLSKSKGTGHWEFLGGQRTYRFLHPEWGDFTVAVCADLLDTAPWRSLRGELLHLFMVAFNKDVDLYESLTWVRAYENYVNLVSVNHGSYGGSFLWTPRRSHGRELARLRGNDLFLVADVKVPVRSLVQAQKDGVERAAESAASAWAKGDTPQAEFKSAPPGFDRRALLDPPE